MTKERKLTVFHRTTSILMIIAGICMIFIALIYIGGFGAMLMLVDLELGARQLSELLMVLGIYSLVFGVFSIIAGVMGCMYASKDAKMLCRCVKIDIWTIVVLIMYFAFLFAVDSFNPTTILMAVIPALYLVSAVINRKQKQIEGRVAS